MNILETVKHTPSKILLKSLQHCHCPHVSSIVINEAEGKLHRIFLVWPNHNLWMNQEQNNGYIHQVYSVGFHDHKYDLELEHIEGHIENISIKPAIAYEDNIRLRTYMVKSRLKEGLGPDVKYTGYTYFSLPQSSVLYRDVLKLTYKNIHTIYVPHDTKAAWLVREGETKQDITHLYTSRNSHPINYCGLYQKFTSKEEIIDHVEEWMKI